MSNNLVPESIQSQFIQTVDKQYKPVTSTKNISEKQYGIVDTVNSDESNDLRACFENNLLLKNYVTAIETLNTIDIKGVRCGIMKAF